jgi:hypothetical protein
LLLGAASGVAHGGIVGAVAAAGLVRGQEWLLVLCGQSVTSGGVVDGGVGDGDALGSEGATCGGFANVGAGWRPVVVALNSGHRDFVGRAANGVVGVVVGVVVVAVVDLRHVVALDSSGQRVGPCGAATSGATLVDVVGARGLRDVVVAATSRIVASIMEACVGAGWRHAASVRGWRDATRGVVTSGAVTCGVTAVVSTCAAWRHVATADGVVVGALTTFGVGSWPSVVVSPRGQRVGRVDEHSVTYSGATCYVAVVVAIVVVVALACVAPAGVDSRLVVYACVGGHRHAVGGRHCRWCCLYMSAIICWSFVQVGDHLLLLVLVGRVLQLVVVVAVVALMSIQLQLHVSVGSRLVVAISARGYRVIVGGAAVACAACTGVGRRSVDDAGALGQSG